MSLDIKRNRIYGQASPVPGTQEALPAPARYRQRVLGPAGTGLEVLRGQAPALTAWFSSRENLHVGSVGLTKKNPIQTQRH